MIKYQEDPDLKLKTVTTVKGIKEYRNNCRKIRDKYYILDEDCFNIDGKWYIYNSKKIAFDYEKKKHVLLEKDPLIFGVVNIKEDGVPVMGHFTENKYNNVNVDIPSYGVIKALNENILEKNGFIEDLSTGKWLYKKALSASVLARTKKINYQKVHTDKGYNIEDNPKEFEEKKISYAEYPHIISAAAFRYGKLLGKSTIGCEIETSNGLLPYNIQHRTGVVICRDGSIKSAEYVTVPMSGAKALVNLKYLSQELTKRTEIDTDCSMHFHIGTLPTDRLYIVSLYVLAYKIQDEVFKMFPYYKTEWKGIKRQSYNEKLKKLGITAINPNMNKLEYNQAIDEAYYKIFTWLNDGIPPGDDFNRNNNRHHQQQKWNRKQRYFWLNFMNMFFSPRRTIEFRLHQPTTNGQKIINWLLICNAIAKYAELNPKKILSNEVVTFDEVLNYYTDNFKGNESTFLSKYLISYVQNRKDYFLQDFKKGDFVSEKEMIDDKKFVFEHEGVQWLF
jgi:hypothetical protein